jgi:hypothetical protein
LFLNAGDSISHGIAHFGGFITLLIPFLLYAVITEKRKFFQMTYGMAVGLGTLMVCKLPVYPDTPFNGDRVEMVKEALFPFSPASAHLKKDPPSNQDLTGRFSCQKYRYFQIPCPYINYPEICNQKSPNQAGLRDLAKNRICPNQAPITMWGIFRI